MNRNIFKKICILLSINIFISILPVAAQEKADALEMLMNQGISIQADETMFSNGGKQNIMSGNVVLELNSLKLSADKIIQNLENGKTIEIIVTGQPVTLISGEDIFHGLSEVVAENIIFNIIERKIYLTKYKITLHNKSMQKGEKLTITLP